MSMRPRRRRIAGRAVVGALAVALLAATAAMAYFRSTGSGTGHSTVGSIVAPSNLTTVQTGANVTISWNASTLSSGGAVQGYRVKRSDGATICGSPTLVTGTSCTDTGPASGTYTYTVTAVYHTFTAAATSGSWTVLTAPSFSSTPPSVSASTSATFAFTGGGGTGYQCQLDSGPFVSCTSPVPELSLANGSHTFKVHAVSGTSTGPDTSYTWTVNSTAPSINSEPSSTSANTAPSFSFSHSAYTSFKCQIDSGGFSACTSPKSLSALAAGSHTFQVEALDASGAATTAASYTWTVNTTAPTITSEPTNPSTNTAPSFSFTHSVYPSFKCQLDAGSLTACSSGVSYSGLSAGSHTFSVVAVGADGSTTSTQSYTWTIHTDSVSIVTQTNGASITTTNGATYIIAVYMQGSSGAGTASVTTGASAPFSAASQVGTGLGIVTSGSGKDYLALINATGNGTTHTFTVTASSTVVYVDVIQLSSGTVVGSTVTGTGTSSPATISLAAAQNSELAIVATGGGTTAETVTPPSGMTAVGTFQSNGSSGNNLGIYFAGTAQSSSSFTLAPASVNWGTIGVPLN